MTWREFLRSTETIIVLGGCLTAFTLGKFWVIPTAIGYILVNMPRYWKWLVSKFQK